MNRISPFIPNTVFLPAQLIVKTGQRPFVQLLVKKTDFTDKNLQPGHIAFKSSASEFKSLQSYIGPSKTSSPGDTSLSGRGYVQASFAIGHQPDHSTLPLEKHTILTTMDRKEVEYVNVTRHAKPLWASQNFYGTPTTHNLGELTTGHLKALEKVMNSGRFNEYSVRGDKAIDKNQLSARDLKLFLTEGKPPRHAPNCVDFAKAVLLEWAALERTSEEQGWQFEAKLADCRFPQDVADLAQAHFSPDEKGFMRFQPDARTGSCVDLRGATHYGKFLEASGLSREVFDKMCSQLAQKGLIFGEVFENDEQWGTTFFSGLGQRLRECKPHEGVGAVCYHKNTYPGDITHVSMIAFSPSGDVAICHHESVVMSKDSPIDNLMYSTAGVPSNTYDTANIHRRVLGRDIETLPIMASYKSSGPPMVQFTSLGDYGGLRDLNEQTTRDAYMDAKEILYGTDPDQHLLEQKGAYLNNLPTTGRTQDNRFQHEPLRLPPGEKDKKSAGAYTNNCAAYTLRCLQAGGCKDLPTTLEYVGELRLSEVADILLQAGLMPCTDPKAAEKMDLAGYKYSTDTGVMAHAGSFLALAYLWSTAAADTPGVYPADVPRNEVSDEKKEALEQKRKKQLDGIDNTISKNQASFNKVVDDLLKSSKMV